MEGRKHIALCFHLRGRSRRLDIGWHIGSFEIDSRVEARLGRDPARNDMNFSLCLGIFTITGSWTDAGYISKALSTIGIRSGKLRHLKPSSEPVMQPVAQSQSPAHRFDPRPPGGRACGAVPGVTVPSSDEGPGCAAVRRIGIGRE